MDTQSRNTKAMKTLALVLAALTYCGAVIYGDIQFLSVMQDTFPNGFMRTLAMAGAVMTAVSAITLPIALHWWFAPGMQFVWGIIFWALDILVLGLNSILAYQIARNTVDPTLAAWGDISPATPLLAVIGWGIAFLLDPSHKLRHAQAELETDLIDTHAQQLRLASKSETVYQEIEAGARDMAREIAGKLANRYMGESGRPVAAQTLAGQARDPQPSREPLMTMIKNPSWKHKGVLNLFSRKQEQPQPAMDSPEARILLELREMIEEAKAIKAPGNTQAQTYAADTPDFLASKTEKQEGQK